MRRQRTAADTRSHDEVSADTTRRWPGRFPCPAAHACPVPFALLLILLQAVLASGCATVHTRVTVQVDLDSARIVVPDNPPPQVQAAATELRWHLQELSDTAVPVLTATELRAQADPSGYRFYVGPDSGEPDMSIPAGWGYVVGRQAALFFDNRGDVAVPTNRSRQAVCAFLANECGVRWIFPGDAGTAFTQPLDGGLRLHVHSWRGPQDAPAGIYAPTNEDNTVHRTLLSRIAAQSGFDPASVAVPCAGQRDWLVRNRIVDGPRSAAAERVLTPLSMSLPTGDHAAIFEHARKLLQHDHDHGPIRINGYAGFIGPNMFRDYALVRLLADPDVNIHDVRNEFLQAFGNAADHVDRYFSFWENVFRNAIEPVAAAATDPADAAARISTAPATLYTRADFKDSLALLQHGLHEHLDSSDKRRLEILISAHLHAKATFTAIRTLAEAARGEPETLANGIEAATRLHAYRRRFDARFDGGMPYVIAREMMHGDVTGYELALLLEGLTPLVSLVHGWHAKPPDTAALAARDIAAAQLAQWPIVKATAPAIAADAPDSGIVSTTFAAVFNLPPRQAEASRVFLVLWALQTPCRIFLNGKPLGEARTSYGHIPNTLRIPVAADALNGIGPQLIVVETEHAAPLHELWNAAWICID